MKPTTYAVESAIKTLSSQVGYWVGNDEYEVEDDIAFHFTSDQFALAQRIISGASLGPTLEDSVRFLVDREDHFNEEAEGCDVGEYCSSGWFTSDFEEGTNALFLWYQTTSGTILSHAVALDGSEEEFFVFLPRSRKRGFHHQQLAYIQTGMTSEQHNRWYNSGEKDAYAELASFHNTHLVPLGFEPMFTGEQNITKGQIEATLRYLHGDWAKAYGVEGLASSIVGPAGEAQFPLKGGRRMEKANAVLKHLEETLVQWRSLIAEWSLEPDETPDYEEYEDYCGCDEE